MKYTKLQQQVLSCVPVDYLTDAQRAWLNKKFDSYGYVTTGDNVRCAKCGKIHKRKVVGNKSVCPHCGNEIHSVAKYNKTRISEYFTFAQACGDIQLVRVFLSIRKFGKDAYRDTFECFRWAIEDTGKQILLSRSVNGLVFYYDAWRRDSNMTPRKEAHYRHEENGEIYPSSTYTKRVKRNGFSLPNYKMYANSSLQSHIHMLVSNPYYETLFKCRQYPLANLMVRSSASVMSHWLSVKQCLRKSVIVADARSYIDYLNAMQELNMPYTEAYYACPMDFCAMHDMVMDRLRKKQERERIARAKQEIQAQMKRMASEREDLLNRTGIYAQIEADYYADKHAYFGISLSMGDFIIRPLSSVLEFLDEGTQMNHCVYRMKYYEEKDSLILSCRDKDGNRIETIEYSLTLHKVMQSRGMSNLPTKYHDNIISIVESNLPKQLSKIAS